MNKKRIAQRLAAMTLAGMLALQLAAPMTSFAAKDNQVKVATSMTQLVKNEDLKVGQVYEGFKLDRQIFSKDLNSKVNLFVHEKNGGQVVYIQSKDQNRWFGATFRTPTVDNTGVNHVLEHTVLEGSKKYPSASNFKDMGKRSVSTYMNALTGADLTYYPVASENAKDFDNLMKVYLDAVFAPLVVEDENLLKREGWRYDLNPQTGEIEFNGIVFNEMKGAMSGRYKVLFTELSRALYPDTKYRFNSGGDPVSIVDLTHEHIAETHDKYYTASNACLMLYGDMNVVEKLKYINDQYYSKMDKKSPIEDLKSQKTFDGVKRVETTYPASPAETQETDSMLLWSPVMHDTTEAERMGLLILSSLLAKDDNTLLYKNTVEAGIGKSVVAQLDTGTYEPSMFVLAQGASNKDMDKFVAAVEKTLKQVAKEGFDKAELESVFNQTELAIKGSLLISNKGEVALETLNTNFVTYGDPLLSFSSSEVLDEIKDKVINDKYLESLIEKYLIGNDHRVEMVFTPDASYMAKINEQLDQKLKERLDSMGEEKLAALKEDIVEYNKWQAQKTPQEHLDALPKLTVEDLDLETDDVNIVKGELDGYTLLKHPVNSVGLTDLNLYFNLQNLTKEELAYLPILTSVMVNSDTKEYTNKEIGNMIANYSLGINFYETTFSNSKDSEKYYPYFVVSSTYASENADKITELMKEYMLNVKLDDKDMVKQKVSELLEAKKQSMLSNPNAVVVSKYSAAMTSAGNLEDYMKSESYRVLKELNADFDSKYSELEEKLVTIYQKLFTADELTISVASEEKDFEKNEKAISVMLKDLNKKDIKDSVWDFKAEKTKLGLTIPAEVQFMQLGFNLKNIGEELNGSDLVFSKLVSDGYMYEKLRLQGGAYGGYLATSASGNVRFGTYRDPKLKESVDVINDLVNVLKEFKPTQEQLDEAIISIVGRIDAGQDLFTETKAENAEILSEYDRKDLEKLKKEILETTPKDLEGFIAKMEKGLKDSTIIVAGSETKINENKDLFDEIRPIDA
ncbi:MAG: insulinase family protein [Tissierellales bacterium]|nr:insulinase family protein [Tissierellales bacterium]